MGRQWSHRLAKSGLWVTNKIAISCSRANCMRSSNTFSEFALSRFPVGSSARSKEGEFESARAMATRCCSPPDNLFANRFVFSPKPSFSSRSSARERASFSPTPALRSGKATFSRAVSSLIRKWNWKTNPMDCCKSCSFLVSSLYHWSVV